MEFLSDLSPEEQKFQQEVRRFYAENLTEEFKDAGRLTMWALSEFEYGKRWQKILHKKKWGAPDWPVEYGGCDWTPKQRMIFAVETRLASPPEVMMMGRDLCAPCIMQFGTEEQKKKYLPRILSGDDWWAQGYSEPGAGSDLASLQLKAESDGDHYVLNGSKIWTTYAQHANKLFCLVRTGNFEKRQMGITFLLLDIDTPGIEIRPLINIAGDHEFNQVFFNNVRVPKSNRLGQEHEGWTVARYLLVFEHGMFASRGVAMQQRLDLIKEIASLESDGYGGRLIDDPVFSKRLAETSIMVDGHVFGTQQFLSSTDSDAPPSKEAAFFGNNVREHGQKMTELAMEAIGYYNMPHQIEARTVGSNVELIGAPHQLTPTPFYLNQRAASIAGGTPEIQRNNMAKNILGL